MATSFLLKEKSFTFIFNLNFDCPIFIGQQTKIIPKQESSP
jgi:hypothetical protein